MQNEAVAVVQVCTGVMLHGYPLVKTLCGGLQVRATHSSSAESRANEFLNIHYMFTKYEVTGRQRSKAAGFRLPYSCR